MVAISDIFPSVRCRRGPTIDQIFNILAEVTTPPGGSDGLHGVYEFEEKVVFARGPRNEGSEAGKRKESNAVLK